MEANIKQLEHLAKMGTPDQKVMSLLLMTQ
jgi:hypothetical protein